MSVVVAFLLAVAASLAAYVDPLALAAVVVASQAALVLGWHDAVGAPGALGGATLAMVAGVGAVVLVLVRENANPVGSLTGLFGAASVAVLVHQLIRRDRSKVVASMSASGALLLLTLMVALYLPAASSSRGSAVVVVVVLAAAAGHATRAVPVPVAVALAVALCAGAGVGVAAAVLTELQPLSGALTGLAAAAMSGLAARGVQGPHQPVPWLLGALPISLAAPVAYAAVRIIGG